MDPKEIHEVLVPEIKEALLYVAAGYPIRRIGQELEALSEYFQALGICHILETVDFDQFRENLVRSAYARRYFLRKSREESNDADLRLALGRTEAFLDAVAAHHLSLAREIAALSIDTWRPAWEYEEDFCYYLFLQHLILGRDSAAESELHDILIRFDQAVDKGDSPRLDICRALLNRDGDGFHASLITLMEQRREELQNLLERMLEPDPKTCVCWARSFVSIEGLALLRMGALQGIAPEPDEELPLCPSLAILSISDRDYVDMFEGIERELARGR